MDTRTRAGQQLYFAPVGVLELDERGTFVDANLYARVLFGPTLGELGQRLDAPSGVLDNTSIRPKRDRLPWPDLRSVHSARWGDVTARLCHMPSNGAITGRQFKGETLFVEAVRVENEDGFRRRLGETWQHALIWQDYAAAYDHILLSLEYYRACVARHLRALRRYRNSRILDIGGGTGSVAVPLARAGCDVTVVDPGRAMLDKLRGKIEPGWRGRVHIFEQSAEQLPAFEDASFGAVNILLALYDMDRPEAALQEAMRVLRPGGLIVITEPRRAFSLEVLLAKVDEELRSKPDRKELEEDWRKVRSANLHLDPQSRRSERCWAEDVAEMLNSAGYRDLGFILSHHDQCATITGIKPTGVGGARMTPAARSLHARGALSPSSVTIPRREAEAPLELRPARPGDGPVIARLYRAVYTPPCGGDAEDHYPFPQFMNGAWVDGRLAAGSVIWIVAETGGKIVGVVGAVANVGRPEDRTSEYFGLVVSADRRNQGIATRLLQGLFDRVVSAAGVMLAETRTAEPWSWRILRKIGFQPLGFEPYAHLTPAGSESMILLAWTSDAALRARRTEGSCTPAVRRLASAVLAQLGAEPLTCVSAAPVPLEGQSSRPAELAVEVSDLEMTARCFGDGRVPASGAHSPSDAKTSGEGVVELHHLCGLDTTDGRYVRKRLVVVAKSGSSAEASFVFDHRDRRARIESCLAGSPSLYHSVIAATLEAIRSVSKGQPFTAVVDVRADAAPLQFCLEEAGFLPTAYLPAAVARGGGRRDVVQYSYLGDLPMAGSLSASEPIDWPEARAVIAAVTGRSG